VNFYRLVDEEAVLLDGRCRPEVQKDVDAAKARLEMAARAGDLSPKEAGFVADIVREAKEKGRLTFCRLGISSCDVCGATAGYYRFKSGRRRGQADHNRPLAIGGVDFGRGFVVMQRRATLGCCWDCWLKLADKIRAELSDVRAEIPAYITGHPPKWRRFDRVKCTKCGWEGHEGEMRQLQTLMGDGKYPGGCPKCTAANTFMGPRLIETTGLGFAVVSSESNTEEQKS